MMTRREKMVKKMLLKELRRMGGGQALGGFSYAEKKHLVQTLNVDFIDREIENMQRYRPLARGLIKGIAAVGVVWAVVSVVLLLMGDPFHFSLHALPPLFLLGQSASLWFVDHLSQRRIFIYEALRELSNADEQDVPLSRALEQADTLIEQIVDREIEIEERHTVRVKSYT